MGKGLEKFIEQIGKGAKDGKLSEENKKVIQHITDVCDDEYDALLAQDHKTWDRCWKFVTDKARKAAVNGCAFIDDPVVYGWIDEYVGLDDKAEVEKEIKNEQELKEKAEKFKAEHPSPAPTAPTAKPRKDDRQLTLFDM